MSTVTRAVVGKPAPDINCHAIVDGQIREISLSGYTQANHWVVLIFFPRAWSFICPTEIRSFSARLEEFLYSRSCAVVFASTDNIHCLRAWNATSELEGGLGGVHVPLISDSNHKISRDYGVLIEEEGVAQRGLFMIDSKGIVRAITINDADVGRSVDEALRVLDALTFKDEYGEGCPVDWKRGDKGIDIATKNKIEGPIEIRKSWTEWARPKLQRAWSGASQRSVTSSPISRIDSRDAIPTLSTIGLKEGRPLSLYSPQHEHPLYSPTSNGNGKFDAQMDSAMAQLKLEHQRIDNMQAAYVNNHGIGTAN